MIKGLRELLDGPNNCICITHKENGENVENCEMFKAGHPVPDQTGELGSKRVIAALEEVGKDDQVLFLISGGICFDASACRWSKPRRQNSP